MFIRFRTGFGALQGTGSSSAGLKRPGSELTDHLHVVLTFRIPVLAPYALTAFAHYCFGV